MRIQSERVWMAGQFLPLQIEVTGDKISRVLPYGMGKVQEDYGSLRIVPGFLDIHTHGAYGFDTLDAEPEGLKNWLRRIPEEGVTGILPTTVTQRPEVLTDALRNAAQVSEEGCEGAELLGIHLEGPFLNAEYRGAQPKKAIAGPSIRQFQEYQKAAGGKIRVITLAPEKDPELELVRYCRKTGVAVSIGHSGASYAEVLLAVANGAASMTHVYNGMSAFHHREPGAVGAALRIRDIYGEIICDGYHCDAAAVNNYFTAKGRDFGILVTDSLKAKQCPPGVVCELGGQVISLDESGLARLTDGTLAGSTLRMNRALKFCVEQALVPFDAALNACTINPARYLGLDNRKGKLAAGYDADLVVLADDYEVVQTYCRGKAMR